MKITIYELLGLIRYNKAPKKIRDNDVTYKYDNVRKDYYDEINDTYLINRYFEYMKVGYVIDKEVEIIEEDNKIEKLGTSFMKQIGNDEYISEPFNTNERQIINKINEIIDKINKE